MNFVALTFLIACMVAIASLPRRWAPVPLLASCFYMTLGQGVEIGPISLPIYRLVLAAGFVRVLVRREKAVGGVNAIDKLMIAWVLWVILASFFHDRQPGSGPIYASGFVYSIGGVYLLSRIWCGDLVELEGLLRVMAWLLIPVAISMIAEHLVFKNYFNVFLGDGMEGVYLRDGKVRAMGPFAHPILAGTVGAVCFPLFCGIWSKFRISATLGLAACIAIVLASTSSGPLMSLVVGIAAVALWMKRSLVRVVNVGLVCMYIVAEIVMERPAYYLISKIDLTGSSTGWHRSRLIERAVEQLNEWWLFGTDETVHWMGLAVDEAGRHSDITNYYIWMGVIAGLPAMLLLIAMLWRSFTWVGKSVRDLPSSLRDFRFMIWCLGAALLSHTVTSLSMGYPDQSVTFFWLNIGVISSMRSLVVQNALQTTDAQPVKQDAKGGRKSRLRSRGGRIAGDWRGPGRTVGKTSQGSLR